MSALDYQIERKIEVNHWIINARWYYMAGILLIGILTKVISASNLHFSIVEMLLIVVVFSVLNLGFLLILKKIEKQKNDKVGVDTKLLVFLGYSQLVAELAAFSFVMHKAGGIESISPVFYFLPIVSASLLFGLSGSITVAIASGILINALTILEYFKIIPHISRFTEDTLDYTALSFGITKTITTSVFYFIIGIFSGFGAKLLFKREAMLKEQAEKLNKESELRNEELKQLDRATKLLTARDGELSDKNWILDAKIKELEALNNSLTGALNDVKEAKMKSEEEKNKTMAIISNFSDPIIVFDKENKLALFNLAAKITLGLKDSDLGTQIYLKENFGLNLFRKLIKKDFAFKTLKNDKEGILLTEEMHIVGEGNEAIYKVITSRVTDSWGNNVGLMKMFFDITREKYLSK